MDSLQQPPFFEQINQVGPLTFLFNSLIGIGVFIALTHHAKLAAAINRLLHEASFWVRMQTKLAQTKFVERIDARVSATYTELNMLEMEPLRSAVMKFERKKDQWFVTIRHEACRNLMPIRNRISGIEAQPQMVEYLISEPKKHGQWLVGDVEDMEYGDLRSLFLYYNIRCFYSISLDETARSYYSLLVTFNRTHALEEGDYAAIHLCAANLKKAMFSPI